VSRRAVSVWTLESWGQPPVAAASSHAEGMALLQPGKIPLLPGMGRHFAVFPFFWYDLKYLHEKRSILKRVKIATLDLEASQDRLRAVVATC